MRLIMSNSTQHKPFSNSGNSTHGGGSRSSAQADIRKISANISPSFIKANSIPAFSASDST